MHQECWQLDAKVHPSHYLLSLKEKVESQLATPLGTHILPEVDCSLRPPIKDLGPCCLQARGDRQEPLLPCKLDTSHCHHKLATTAYGRRTQACCSILSLLASMIQEVGQGIRPFSVAKFAPKPTPVYYIWDGLPSEKQNKKVLQVITCSCRQQWLERLLARWQLHTSVLLTKMSSFSFPFTRTRTSL